MTNDTRPPQDLLPPLHTGCPLHTVQTVQTRTSPPLASPTVLADPSLMVPRPSRTRPTRVNTVAPVVLLAVSACGSGAPSGGADSTGSYMTGPPPGFTTGACDTDDCDGCNPAVMDASDPAQVGQWSAVLDWSNDPTGIPAKIDCAGQPDCNPGPGLLAIHAVHLPSKKILFWDGIVDQYLWDIDTDTFEYVPADFTYNGCSFDYAVDCTMDQDCFDYCMNFSNNDCPEPLVPSDPLLDCVPVASLADLFCAGHTHRTNGLVLAAGGNVTGSPAGGGRKGIIEFDGIESWTNTGSETFYPLWYPSLTTLPDDRVLIFGGDFLQNSTSVYNPATGTSQITVNHPTDPTIFMITYPFMFVAPDGRVFYAGAEGMGDDVLFDGYYFDSSTLTWNGQPGDQDSSIPGGSAVMFASGRVMKSGGCTSADSRCDASDAAERIDLNDVGLPQWEPTCPMNHPRHFHTLTVLPDGTVLATGGNTRGNGENSARCAELDGPAECDPGNGDADCTALRCAVYNDQSGEHRFPGGTSFAACTVQNDCAQPDDFDPLHDTMDCISPGAPCVPWVNAEFATKSAELWIPQTGQWVELATQQHERMYHSVAILLPDARVLTAGNGERRGLTDQRNAEIFSPPYLFWGPRPEITSAPLAPVAHDTEFDADVAYTPPSSADETGASSPADSIARATLVRLGSVTHQFDMDQRLIELDITARVGDTVTMRAPQSANLAPDGWYMLFLLADSGVPSEAAYVQLQ